LKRSATAYTELFCRNEHPAAACGGEEYDLPHPRPSEAECGLQAQDEAGQEKQAEVRKFCIEIKSRLMIMTANFNGFSFPQS